MSSIKRFTSTMSIFDKDILLFQVDCCLARTCWCFVTRGLCTVGQDEVIIVLECIPHEKELPRDVFTHLLSLYHQAARGLLTRPAFPK